MAHAQPVCPNTPKELCKDARSYCQPLRNYAPVEVTHIDQRTSSPSQHSRKNGDDDAETVDINPRSCEHASAPPLRTAQRLPTEILASPIPIANIGTRRSDHTPTLLQSPARAGHVSRMRQLFKNASRDHHEVQHANYILYPQLPNVSRKASPSPAKTSARNSACQQATASVSPNHQQESICLSTNLCSVVSIVGDVQASLPHPSQRLSESWSDDSGYIVTASQGQKYTFATPLEERVYRWLFKVSDCESMNYREISNLSSWPLHTFSPGQHESSTNFFSRYYKNLKEGHKPRLLPKGRVMLKDPFVCDDKERVSASSQKEPTASALKQHTSMLRDPFVCDNKERVSASSQKELTASALKQHTSMPNYFGEFHIPSKEHFNTLTQDGVYVTGASSRLHEDITLETGGIQLSPNVCIERGPSRHHSGRKPRNASTLTTPCKKMTNRITTASSPPEGA